MKNSNQPLLTGDFRKGAAIDRRRHNKECGNVFSGNTIGGHAEGEKTQCCGISTTTGRRCRKYSLRGRNYCKSHGGGHHVTSKRFATRRRRALKYSSYMGKTLKDRVETLSQDTKPMESLRDELQIMRALACDALELYNMATHVSDADKRQNMQLRAGEHVIEALNNIRDMTYAVIKIEKESQKALDVALIGNMASQFVEAIDTVLIECGDDLGMDPRVLAQKMSDHIYNTVMIDVTTSGTSLSPDQDVAAMIATIPAEPEGEIDVESVSRSD